MVEGRGVDSLGDKDAGASPWPHPSPCSSRVLSPQSRSQALCPLLPGSEQPRLLQNGAPEQTPAALCPCARALPHHPTAHSREGRWHQGGFEDRDRAFGSLSANPVPCTQCHGTAVDAGQFCSHSRAAVT